MIHHRIAKALVPDKWAYGPGSLTMNTILHVTLSWGILTAIFFGILLHRLIESLHEHLGEIRAHLTPVVTQATTVTQAQVTPSADSASAGDRAFEDRNKWVRWCAIAVIMIMVGCTAAGITFLYVAGWWVGPLPVLEVLAENLVAFGMVALVEYGFTKLVAARYEVAHPSEVSDMLFARLNHIVKMAKK
jgi:hypothetical protein